jgi:hypothetical protein
MLNLGVAKMLAASSIALGTVLGASAATLPTEDAPVLLLSLSSLISIGLGFYWYGRLTERVKSECEQREKLEARVLSLENESTAPRIIEKMADDIDRLTRAVIMITTRLAPNDPAAHDLLHESYTPGTARRV